MKALETHTHTHTHTHGTTTVTLAAHARRGLIKHSLNNAYFHICPLFSQHVSRADYTEVYIGSCLEREMADGWYDEWTDWRHDGEQQATKEPPKKRLRPYTFLAAS